MAREAGWGGAHTGEQGAEGSPDWQDLVFRCVEGQAPSGSCGMWQRARPNRAAVGRALQPPPQGHGSGPCPRAGSWLSVLPFFPHWSSRSSVFGSRSKASLFTQTVDGANCEFMRDMPSCCYCYYCFDHSSSSKVGDRGPEGSLYFPPGYLPAFSVGFPPVWARALDGDCDMPQC